MDTYTDIRQIILSSNHGKSLNGTYKSNMFFPFQSILTDDADIIQTQISLDNAQIPVSFYTVNYTNNILNIIANGSPYTLTIPVGNYNFNSLSSKIETLFNALTIPMVITIDKVSGVVTFTKTSSPASLSFSPTSTIVSILGGLANTTYTFTGNTLTMPYPLNLLGIKRLSIVSNLLPTYSYSSLGVSNILATVDVNSASFGIINFQNSTQVKHLLRGKTISNIDIQILDENGNFVNFNNADFTICISIEILRKLTISNSTFNDVLASFSQPIQDNPPTEEELPPEPTPLNQNLTNQDIPEFELGEDTDLALLNL